MIRKNIKAIAVIIFLFTSVVTQAQNLIYRIQIPEQKTETHISGRDTIVYIYKKETTSSKKENSSQERGMIGRESFKNVFVPKGQWMLGGQISWNQWDNDNLNYLVLKDINFEGYTFAAGPYFGYFFADNMSVGGRFNYHRYYMNLGEFDLSLGDDFNIGMKDLYYLQHNYETSLFVRTYLPIGTSKVFGLFGEFQFNYTFSEGKNSTGRDETFSGIYEKVHNLELGIGGGMAVFLAKNVAAEVMLNVGGFNVKWGKQNVNNIEEGKLTSSGANFRINLFSIKFGVTYFL